MDKKTASRIWVEINAGRVPPEWDGPLETHEQRWGAMEKVRTYASRAEVNRLWDLECGSEPGTANIALTFGHE